MRQRPAITQSTHRDHRALPPLAATSTTGWDGGWLAQLGIQAALPPCAAIQAKPNRGMPMTLLARCAENPSAIDVSPPVWRVAALLTPLVVLAGCANLTQAISIQKRLDTHGPNAYSIGAKQRVILSNPMHDEVGKQWIRLCAEPAPDVFSALAASLATEVSADKGISQVGAAAKLVGGFSEGASTIERTQTLNLLRETMYRTCERYLNGAIDKDEFVIQAARDQRMAVTVLAIEQLTGVVRNNATALTAVASASAAGSPAVLLVNAKNSVEKAKVALDDAAQGVIENINHTECAGKSKDMDVDEEKKAKFENACRTYKFELDHYDRIAKSSATTGSVDAKQQTFANIGATQQAAAITGSELLTTVKEIVQLNDNFPEGLMFCLTRLRTSSKWVALPGAIQASCQSLLQDQLAKDRAELNKEKELSEQQAASARLATTELENAKVQIQARTVIDRSRLEGPWGVVFGGDNALRAAQDELKNAKQWGLVDPRIYFRGGVYRSVSVSADSATAQAMLRVAITHVPKRQPYLVNLSTWCIEPTPSRQGDTEITGCK